MKKIHLAFTVCLFIINISNAQTFNIVYSKYAVLNNDYTWSNYSPWKRAEVLGSLSIDTETNKGALVILTKVPHYLVFYAPDIRQYTEHNRYEMTANGFDVNNKPVSLGIYIKYDGIVHISLIYLEAKYLFQTEL